MKNIHLQLRNLIGQIESAMIQGEIFHSPSACEISRHISR